MVESRLNKPLALAAIAVALVLGVLLGISSGLVDRIFGGPSPQTIASSSLESMRAQNRLIVFAARYVSVTSSSVSRLGFSTERTLILPGDVRYEVNLAKLQPKDVRWDKGTSTLDVRIPDIEIAGPDVDLNAVREYGSGGVLSVLTDANGKLDQTNRARAVADLRKQALAAVPMRLARDSARAAVERSFAMPLKAAGFDDVKVVARFAFEQGGNSEQWDLSRSYNEVLEEAARKRAASGQ